MKTAVAMSLLLAVALPAWAQSAPPAAPGAAKPATADKRQPAAKSPGQKIDARAVLQAMEEAFSAVADRVTPAVVNVSTIPKRTPPGTTDDPERFRDYFGEEFYDFVVLSVINAVRVFVDEVDDLILVDELGGLDTALLDQTDDLRRVHLLI